MDHGKCDRNDLICKIYPFFEAIRSTSRVIGAFGAYCPFTSHTMVSGLANLPLFPATLRLTGVLIVFIVEVSTIFVTTGTCLAGTSRHFGVEVCYYDKLTVLCYARRNLGMVSIRRWGLEDMNVKIYIHGDELWTKDVLTRDKTFCYIFGSYGRRYFNMHLRLAIAFSCPGHRKTRVKSQRHTRTSLLPIHWQAIKCNKVLDELSDAELAAKGWLWLAIREPNTQRLAVVSDVHRGVFLKLGVRIFVGTARQYLELLYYLGDMRGVINLTSYWCTYKNGRGSDWNLTNTRFFHVYRLICSYFSLLICSCKMISRHKPIKST